MFLFDSSGLKLGLIGFVLAGSAQVPPVVTPY
jgi:hypothetical protein